MKRWLLPVSLALNALVLLALLALSTMGRHVVAAFFLAPARERLVSFFAANPVGAGDVVLLGDSLTDGARWDELLPDIAAKNRGVPGDTTDDVLARLDQVTSGAPARVLLMVGTNDLGRGASVERTAARYREILARLRRDSPVTRIYAQSILPRAAPFRAEVEALNREIERAAREHGAVWIDLYPAFLADDGSIRDDLSNDDLHLLGPGYALWRDRIASHLRDPLAAGHRETP
jgi:lysophospholipase L1-like esterase